MRNKGAVAAVEAQEWCGTKFLWQQSVKGLGCDCKGLVAGVARECGFSEAQSVHALARDYSDRKPVPSVRLRAGLDEVFDRVEFDRNAPTASIQPGDVLLMVMKGRPDHLAIVGPQGATAIHAQIGPKNWVKETSLEVLLRAYRLSMIYRWKE